MVSQLSSCIFDLVFVCFFLDNNINNNVRLFILATDYEELEVMRISTPTLML